MKIEIPAAQPRQDGEYGVHVSKGYGNPHGTIALDENWKIVLDYLNPEDCDGLIRAAAEIKERVLAYRAEMAGPHGTKHLYKGRCQLCDKPEDDELHAEPAADEDGPCMKVGCGHGYDDHSLDLEQGDRLYCQRCECRRFLSATAMREDAEPAAARGGRDEAATAVSA